MNSRREFLKLGTIASVIGYMPLSLQAFNSAALSGGRKRFLEACIKGDSAAVEKMLQRDKELLLAKDNQGRGGFALALLAGRRATAEIIKKYGYLPDLHETVLALDWERYEQLVGEEAASTASLINADHPLGGCAMWAAAAGGAGADIWRVYAKSGDPNCNPREKAGTTALQKALRYPDLKTAEITAASLLSNDANPDPVQNAGLPPLHIAAERGSLELTEMLVRLGAAVGQKDQKGRTAAQLAEKSGHHKVWEMLQNHHQIARTCRTSRAAYDRDGRRYEAQDISDIPLYLRGRFVGQAHGNLEYVQKELKAEPRMVHSVATTSEKCIEACAHTGRKKVVEHLLKYGAPYSLPTAVLLNDYTTVKRLLDEDPDRIHERGAHDFALLWYPVLGQCDLDMTQLLLDRGAAVEQQHYLGTSALHWAAMRGPIELVELLLENGADVNRSGRKFRAEGQRPLQMTKDEKIADYLRTKGAR